MKAKTWEVILFPAGFEPEFYYNCSNVDCDNLSGGIMFTTEGGDYYRSTLPYKVRPAAVNDEG